MTCWTSDAVLAAYADSTWVPPGAREVQTDLVHFHVLDRRAKVIDITPCDLPASELVASVRRTVAEHGADRLRWIVTDPELRSTMLALHGEVKGRFDVCAADLTRGAPEIPVPADVTVATPETPADQRDTARVHLMAWGNPEPSEDELTGIIERGTDGKFLARLDGRPAGIAGYTLTGPVARLWAGAVLPELRGRGVYRALVDARIRDAIDHGATLAVVSANVGTSAPILRRIGFTAYGQAVEFELPAG